MPKVPPPPGKLPRVRTTHYAGRPGVEFDLDGTAIVENYSISYPYGLDDERVRVQVEFMAVIDRGGNQQRDTPPQPEPDTDDGYCRNVLTLAPGDFMPWKPCPICQHTLLAHVGVDHCPICELVAHAEQQRDAEPEELELVAEPAPAPVTVNVTVQGSVASDQQIADAVRRHLRLG
jgi:hypothetical protein